MMSKDIDNIDDDFIMIHKGHIYSVVIGGMEKMLIEKALKRSFGNKIIAAKMLGIHRNTLYNKVRRLGIDSEKFKI
ncbi:MAG: helix-turn-helix domain-containing protein [Candidatus Omnitrophota bacterium]